MATPLPDSDGDLVLLALEGRQDAFSALYERYFPSVFDFLTRLLRNREEAADLAQDTFMAALEQLPMLKQPERFKSWLFTIAHRAGLNRIRTSKRTTAVGAVDDDERATMAVADADPSANPEEMAAIQEAADIVWEAAAGLDPRTYAVMDLHVRQGLDSAEIAEVMGVTKGYAYTMVSRMKQSFSNTLATYLLVRKGRQDCDDLAGIVEPDASKMTPELRRKADRHVAKCGVCSENRALLFEPVKMFAALMLVPVPAGLKAAIWGSIAATGTAAAAAGTGAATASGAGASAGGGGGAGAATAAAASHTSLVAAAAAAVIVVAVAVGGIFLSNGGPDPAEAIAAPVAVDSAVAEPGAPPTVASGGPGDAPTTTIATTAAVADPTPPALLVADDSVALDEDTSLAIDVTANDSGLLDPASVSVAANPANGTAQTATGGIITYTPTANFAGSDRLEYSVADTTGRTGRGVVTITVRQVNDAPSVPGPGVLTVDEDERVTFDPIEGAADVDGDVLSVDAYDLASTAGGTLSAGGAEYTPPPDFSGSDTFSYVVTDGIATVPVTVTVQVAAVPDAPERLGGGLVADGIEDLTAFLNLLTGWTDADGDALTVAAGTISSAQGGVATIAANGATSYTPPANFSGSDTIAYSVTDGDFTVAATATVTVAAVNDAPTISNGSFTVAAGAAPGSIIGRVSASDPDVGESLAYTIAAGNTGGQITINASGDLVVNTISDTSVFPLSLTVRVTDSGGLSDTATVTIGVSDTTGPSVSGFAASPGAINASPGPGVSCPVGASRATLSATVTDPSGIASVSFTYQGVISGITFSGSVAGTMSGSTATGSFAITVTGLTFTQADFTMGIVATDGLGNSSTVGGVTITVLPCPG